MRRIKSGTYYIVNLEAPLSDWGVPACKSGAVFKGEQEHVNGLLAAPFDVVTLSNNEGEDLTAADNGPGMDDNQILRTNCNEVKSSYHSNH